MNTQTSIHNRVTSADLIASITKHIEQLAEATNEARVSEEMLRYLEACSRFHHYSLFNLWLILMDKPQATYVAGFHKWQSLNRYVKKGEHGIPILAPVIVKEDSKDSDPIRKLVGFKVVYVFDLSQTEGEPFPEPPEWKSLEKNALLTERLIQFANSRGISVTEKELIGDVQGVSKGGSIEIIPGAGTSTFIHEIAHEMLHHGSDHPMDPKVCEMEAESVAYVVARHFGLDNLASPNYIGLHGANTKMIMDHLEIIRATSAKIISVLEMDITICEE